MELVVVEGPLTVDLLDDIADLYGAHDPKYRSKEFLELKFNRNPTGFSLHVFAYQGTVPVGHCCIIPLALEWGGSPIRGGKAECFVVAPGARNLQAGDGTPLGLAIPARLYSEAFARGYEWLHLQAAPSVARIHKYCGFKEIDLPTRRWVQCVRPWHPERPHRSGLGLAIRVLAGLSGVLSAVWRYLPGFSLREDRDPAIVPDLDQFFRPGIQTAIDNRLAMRLTPEVQEWYQQAGVKILALTNGAWLAYYLEDADVEILGMDPKAGFWSRGFLLSMLRSRVRMSGARQVSWLHYPNLAYPIPAASLLTQGYATSRTRRRILLHPRRGIMPMPMDLVYSPLFYVTF